MFDDQHDCQAFVRSSVLLYKPARIRVALSATKGILSALAPLLIKETVFLLSEHRQASERQEPRVVWNLRLLCLISSVRVSVSLVQACLLRLLSW